MINDNENEAENGLHRYDINWPRHGHKYTKYKLCLSLIRDLKVDEYQSYLSVMLNPSIVFLYVLQLL